MTNNNPLRLIYATVCDGVRIENNGKELYIGVYTGSINLNSSTPTFTYPITIVLHGNASNQAEFNVEFRISLSGNTLLQDKLSASRELPEGGVSIIIDNVPLKDISKNEMLTVETKLPDDDDWQIIRSVPVLFSRVEPQTQSAP